MLAEPLLIHPSTCFWTMRPPDCVRVLFAFSSITPSTGNRRIYPRRRQPARLSKWYFSRRHATTRRLSTYDFFAIKRMVLGRVARGECIPPPPHTHTQLPFVFLGQLLQRVEGLHSGEEGIKAFLRRSGSDRQIGGVRSRSV
jgi:hypothetical protein